MVGRVVRAESNPEFEELSELLERARTAAERVGRVLQRPAALMLQDRVWTGVTTAADFAAELDGRRGDLPLRLEAFVDAVEGRRARVPATVDVPAWEL